VAGPEASQMSQVPTHPHPPASFDRREAAEGPGGFPGSLVMKTRSRPTTWPAHRSRTRWIVVAALAALALETGCGREFYREWANQDVSEAVFEKSRDPRYRLDLFSVEPPALARFADPYDPDRPPAPPDDFAAQSLSPVPQWPDHRLIMPVEGTGYLKLLDQGPRYDSPPPMPVKPKPAARPAVEIPPPPPIDGPPFAPPATPGNPGPATPPNPAPASGASSSNSGTKADRMSPTSLATRPSPSPSTASYRPGDVLPSVLALAKWAEKDDAIQRAAIQQTPAAPMPNQTPAPTRETPATVTSPTDPLKIPQLPGDPNPSDTDLSRPTPLRNLRPDQSPAQYREAEAASSNLARMFVPENVPFDEAIAGGQPSNSKPYLLSMEKAYQLAILNSRQYQYQLENMYVNALPVTLQRFAFGPQFVAGLTPTTGIGGAGSALGGRLPAVTGANSFLYNTRGTGAQASTLNISTVAGVGKLFDNGAQVLLSFANQLVFNFVGKNPMQPTVRSFLPFQAVVPFLRGGGRAVTLEALTQAERSLLYSVRSFAKFRQEFIVTTLTGGTIIQFGTSITTGGFTSGGGPNDPAIGFLNVVEDVQLVENLTKNLSVFERFLEVYKELVNGESSGLTQLQVDQVDQQVQNARSNLIQSQTQYRNDLDQYKIQLGMPPDVPLIIDRARTLPFKRVFENIDKWSLTDRREIDQLDGIIADLPDLQDIVLEGRSFHGVFTEKDIPHLEDLMLTAERVALENRLDLMNARAQLYDTWRQIRVSANALKGVLNVAVTNEFLTPPTTNNPFGFVSQAKQFSLVLNAELPLVRVAERNAFRTQLINYQRQRRVLQNTEDFLKYQLRSEIRQMQVWYTQYKLAERNLVLSVRVKDQAFEQIIAPPQPNQTSQGAVQTNNLISAQSNVVNQENNLVTFWYQYQLQRLQVYRDLGILPFDEWEAFDELFPPDRSGRGADVAIGPDGRPAVAGPFVRPPQAVGAH